MNRVGAEGRGESVWLAWFLATTLRSFAEQAAARGDGAVAAELREHAEGYLAAVEEHGWDGAWYRRAYDDAGVPLGSSASEECRIDSIAQSWSVICGGGRPERRLQAMRSVEEHLVDREARPGPPAHAAVRPRTAGSGLHQGLPPRGARERRAVHPRRGVGGARPGDGRRRRGGAGALPDAQPAEPRTDRGGGGDVQGGALRGGGGRVHRGGPASAAAGGPGTPARRAGCTAWASRPSWDSPGGETRSSSLPCVPAAWREYAIDYRFGGSLYSLRVVRDGGAPGITLDGGSIEGSAIPLVDDGRPHTAVFRIR